jgi:hypothetical protein
MPAMAGAAHTSPWKASHIRVSVGLGDGSVVIDVDRKALCIHYGYGTNGRRTMYSRGWIRRQKAAASVNRLISGLFAMQSQSKADMAFIIPRGKRTDTTDVTLCVLVWVCRSAD